MAIQSKLENEKHTINETLQTLEKKINDEKSKMNLPINKHFIEFFLTKF
jgi:hypothetical protein